MPRIARSRRGPGWLEPGRTYHVTNRGIDRCDIFHSDLDRLLFLALFADACVRYGVVCHAWCLMSNHFHAVLEDPRGMLSQALHSVEGVYAQYFNDTRPGRRTGSLFEGRFRAELIDSPQYFEDACAYVVLNPLGPQVPLAPSAEAYRWSSAALVCTDCTPAESVAALLDPMGGIEGAYNLLRPSSRPEIRERRRRRLEALASGEWLERDHVLAGRTPEQYKKMLSARATQRTASKSSVATSPSVTEARTKMHPATIASRPAHPGEEFSKVIDELRFSCEAVLPAEISLSEFLLYQAYRFTSATIEELARRWKLTVDTVHSILDQMRERRLLSTAWQRILWSLEWGLRWRLRSAPLRA